MAYTIRYEKETGIVRLDITGPMPDAEDHVQAREKVIEECEKYAVTRVLVHMPDQESMMDSDSYRLYDFGATFTHKRIPIETRIAVVRSKENFDASFVGAAARSHGVNFREFDTADEAISWLKP